MIPPLASQLRLLRFCFSTILSSFYCLFYLFGLLFFPFVMGMSLAGTSSPQMVAVVYTPRVSAPKGTPDKATFAIEMKKPKLKRGIDAKRSFFLKKKSIFHLTAVCLWDFSCLNPHSLKRSYDWQQRREGGEKEKEETDRVRFSLLNSSILKKKKKPFLSYSNP